MNEQTPDVLLETAAITDRGLNQRRPLNEDSYLLDAERRIFAVADGVGGAEAGEVASKTAVEVLGEAFRHHQTGDDIEDLMEIAIQRANASIYQMAHEHPKFSMMATTIVALHLDGRRATIGHVGDSRLYRLAPDGTLHRETEDHSMVEEEVRAGRMSPEQAASHPSRNVISRALGADSSVEVDLKTMEVEDGTVLLLCSDGITRHLSDDEIREILSSEVNLEAACAKMKDRCYERGAEDNLTAVAICVGPRASQTASATSVEDDERTVATGRSTSTTSSSILSDISPATSFMRGEASAAAPANSSAANIPPPVATLNSHAKVSAEAPQFPQRSATGKAGRVFGLLFLIISVAAAFYGGMRYKQLTEQPSSNISTVPTTVLPSPTPESAEASYERRRREVDRAPAAEAKRMANENNGQPLDSNDPEFLYLYGRALMLSGQPDEALKAFERVIKKIDEQKPAGRDPLKVEARIATAAAALKSKNRWAGLNAAQALDDVIEKASSTNTPETSPTPAPSPQG